MRLRFAAFIALSAIAVAGCGSGGSAGADTDDSKSKEPSKPIAIKLTLGAAAFPLLDGLVAMGAGLFEANGLDVGKPPYLDAQQGAITAAQGQTDIFEGATPGFFSVLDVGRPIVALGKGPSTSTVIVTVSTKFADELKAKGVTPDSPLADRVKALQGASIGTSAAGGSVETLIRSMFQDFDVPEDDQKYPAVAEPAALVGGLKQNQFDALAQSAPTALQPVIDNSGVVFINAATDSIPSWKDVFYMTHSTSPDFIKKNPEAVSRYIKAITQAQEMIATASTADVAAAVKPYFPDLNDELIEQSIEAVAPLFADGPRISLAQYEAGLNQYKTQNDASTLSDSGNGAFDAAVYADAQQ